MKYTFFVRLFIGLLLSFIYISEFYSIDNYKDYYILLYGINSNALSWHDKSLFNYKCWILIHFATTFLYSLLVIYNSKKKIRALTMIIKFIEILFALYLTYLTIE
jgi:hypothetical protein